MSNMTPERMLEWLIRYDKDLAFECAVLGKEETLKRYTADELEQRLNGRIGSNFNWKPPQL